MAIRFAAARGVILLGFALLSCSAQEVAPSGRPQGAPAPSDLAKAPLSDGLPDALSPEDQLDALSLDDFQDVPSPVGLPDEPPPDDLQDVPSAGGHQDDPPAGGSQGAPPPGGHPESETSKVTVFDVTDYGAVADAQTDNVEAFMKTWIAACHWRGPSKVVIPEGKFLVGQTVFQGPCNSPDPIVVETRGTILAQPDLSEYPSPEWFMFEDINQLVVKGGGTFDGQGAFAWKYNDCHQNANCLVLPTNLKFHKVNNSVVQDITSLNSKSFHFFVTNSYNFTAFNLTITAPGNSPNTDGMHLSRCHTVNLSNFTIKTGDDCLSVGQGNTNVNITGMYCGPGHGLSVGSLGKYPNEEDVKGIVWRSCTLNGTTNGARIKTWPGSPPSQASSIVYQDIVMNDVKNPIIIDQKYGAHLAKPSRVKISNVIFKNIAGTTISKVPVTLSCSELVPCDGIQMMDINLAYNGPPNFQHSLPFSSLCQHAKVSYSGKQNPPPCP